MFTNYHVGTVVVADVNFKMNNTCEEWTVYVEMYSLYEKDCSPIISASVYFCQ